MLANIKFDQVKQSYNGRSGCACGCNGKYALPSHASLQAANKAVGYDAYDDSDVSDRKVKICLNKINDAIDKYGPLTTKKHTVGIGDTYDYTADGVWFCYTDSWVALDLYGRANTIYYNKGN